MSLVVHKFGGSSLEGADRLRWAAARARTSAAEGPTAVVVSAIAGTTDVLYGVARLARERRLREALDRFAELEEHHLELLELVAGTVDHDLTRRSLQHAFSEQRALLHATARLGELTPHAENDFVGLGERASARVVAIALAAAGVEAVPVDAQTFLVTDDGPLDATPAGEEARAATRQALAPILDAGRVPVVTGFLGRSRDGRVTTLGRSGSDLSATFVAAALDATEVTLWTDVDGIHSADPGLVDQARTLARMHYREAEMLAELGARVLHPRATFPAAEREIPIFVRKSGDDLATGTEISSAVAEARPTVRAIGVLDDRTLLVAQRERGTAALTALLASELADPRALSCLVVASPLAEAALVVPRALADALVEAHAGLERREEVAQVALVGHRLAEAGDVTGRAARALSEARIPRLAVATSDAAGVATFLVPLADRDGAVRTLHEEFRLERGPVEEEAVRGVELIVLGEGRTTAEWLRELERERPAIAERFGLGPRVTTVCDGRSAVIAPAGLGDSLASRVRTALESGAELPRGTEEVLEPELAAVVRARMDRLPRRPLVVDLFEDDRALEARELALEAGADVVVAHPRALGDREAFRRARRLADEHGRELLFEAALVPGLPVREALERLTLRERRVTFVEACLSGAVNGALSRVEEGAAFSSAWAEVLELGGFGSGAVAELGGRAVEDRALALGRAAGLFEGEVEVVCRGLVGPEAEGLGPDALYEHLLATVDAAVRDRVEGCLDSGERLRFVARLEPGRLEIGALEVPRESPIGSLHGPDDLVALYAGRGRREPLVLRGPGAREDVLLGSVLGDLVRVFERRR